MHIKPFARLNADDLPFAESPDLAAQFFKRSELHPGTPTLRFNWASLFGRNAFAPPEVIRAQVLSGLASGKLILVHDALSPERPQLPLAVWVPDSGARHGGAWIAGAAGRSLALSDGIERLNRAGKTPQSLGLAQKAGPSNAGGKESRDSAQAADAGPKDHRLSLPLSAAAGVAALANAAESGEKRPGDDAQLIDLTVGIFTDGTLNNYQNIQEFRERLEKECLIPLRGRSQDIEECQTRLGLLLGESYANEPTNVVKLFSLYQDGEEVRDGVKKVFIKVYEPGVGTRSGDDDSLWGMATGLGETGVQAQVDRAFAEVAYRLSAEVDISKVRSIQFDLFGFSRGAAASRHAANEILSGSEGALGRIFRDTGVFWSGRFSVRFMGLFDTVAGVVNPLRFDFSAGNERNQPVDIHLDPGKLGRVVHIAALDEFRANFALNSICNSADKTPHNFREIYLPGAHSDIGGGYSDVQVEDLLLYPELQVTGRDTQWPRKTLEWDNLQGIKKREEAAGWIGDFSLQMADETQPSIQLDETFDHHPLPYGRVSLELKFRRKVLGGLSGVSLHLIHSLATQEGVPLSDLGGRDDLGIVPELSAIYDDLSTKVLAGENVPILEPSHRELLKQRYVHHSHHFNAFRLLALDEIGYLEPPFRALHSSQPEASYQRAIYWNETKD